MNENTRILLIDDDAYARDFFKTLLGTIGFTSVVEACDGGEGLNKLYDLRIDLVIVDLNMSPIDGHTFLKSVRTGNSAAQRNLPIIVLTESNDEHEMGHALALDCNAYLTKPSSHIEIADYIWRVLSSPITVKPSIAYKVIHKQDPGWRAPALNIEEVSPDAVFVKAKELQPGHVLAADMLSPSGQVLLTQHRCLTSSLIKRLIIIDEVLGPLPIAIVHSNNLEQPPLPDAPADRDDVNKLPTN